MGQSFVGRWPVVSPESATVSAGGRSPFRVKLKGVEHKERAGGGSPT